jgi:endonuclease YncB( thermonuclease family)
MRASQIFCWIVGLGLVAAVVFPNVLRFDLAKKPELISGVSVPTISESPKPPFRLPFARLTQPHATDRQLRETPNVSPTTAHFRRVVVQNGGMFKTDKQTVHLAGLDALDYNDDCVGALGENWPCGHMARAALRRLIRARDVVCSILENLPDNAIMAHCKVAGIDINEWVIRQGWARPSSTATRRYAEGLDDAKRNNRGQWRNFPSSSSR